jgi:hypothetical protein
MGDLEHQTRARMTQPMAALAMPIRIPLVVQVVWRTQNERISKAQADSQVEALNRDYRARNADKSNARYLVGTTDASEFALATGT